MKATSVHFCILAVSAAKWQTLLIRYFRTFSVIFSVTVSDYTHNINIVQDRSHEGEKWTTINSFQAISEITDKATAYPTPPDLEGLLLQNVLIFLASVDLNFVVYFPLTNFLRQVYMSYLQIYQEKIYDLLNTNSKVDLVLREDPKKGTNKMYQISVEYDIYHSTADISRRPHWLPKQRRLRGTSRDISYWWRVTTEIWVAWNQAPQWGKKAKKGWIFWLIKRTMKEICFNQSEVLILDLVSDPSSV